MESNFSIFDLERRKWELNRRRGGSSASVDVGDGPGETDGPNADSSVQDGVGDLFADLVEAAGLIAKAVRAGDVPDPRPVVAAVRAVVERELVDRLYEQASLSGMCLGPQDLSAFVALASMKIGAGLSFTPKKTVFLGVAAMLHDVGRHRLPERLRVPGGGLSPQDRAKLRTLPAVSAQIIERMGSDFSWLAEVASQVGERSDGSGAPQGLEGKEISEFASILGLVTHIASAHHDKPHANPCLQSESIRDVVNNEKQKFPRRILKEFLDQISLFPVNTLVRLNNDSIGRVLATYKSQPMRPTIELLYDGLGKRKDTAKVIHLSSFPLLHIVEALGPDELDLEAPKVREDEGDGDEQ